MKAARPGLGGISPCCSPRFFTSLTGVLLKAKLLPFLPAQLLFRHRFHCGHNGPFVHDAIAIANGFILGGQHELAACRSCKEQRPGQGVAWCADVPELD